MTSTAAHTYPGRSGLRRRKHAERPDCRDASPRVGRGEPIRVTEIAPGMVKTEKVLPGEVGRSAGSGMYAGVEATQFRQ